MAKFELSDDERQDIAERVADILKKDIVAPIEAPKTYTSHEAGEILNRHHTTVSKHCRIGIIPATKQGKGWLISHETIINLIQNKQAKNE